MRKKLLAVWLGITMAVGMLTACGAEEDGDEESTVIEESKEPGDEESTVIEESKEPGDEESAVIEESKEPGDEESIVSEESEEPGKDAFLEFLSGSSSLMTAPLFAEDDEDYNFDGLFYGEYTYPELKVAMELHEDNDTSTKYAFVDINGDGKEEIALRFEGTDNPYMNWTGIIRYNGEGLELVYAYEDGYRTFSNLYESGHLSIGGSFGAGAHGVDYIGFDENYKENRLSTCNFFYGSFATQIAYDLKEDYSNLPNMEDYGSLMNGDSEMEVTEYYTIGKEGKEVKISVSGYSSDPEVRADEEKLINDLISLGAELVSQEEMEKLCNVETGSEVTWIDWEEKCTILKAVSEDFYYGQPETYLYSVCSDSDYAVDVVVSSNKKVTDVHVLSLTYVDMDENGQIVYSGTDMDVFEELIPGTPLRITMEFVGDMPSVGISYVDEKGERKLKAIGMSGRDGSIYLEEAKLEK